ncbi:DUF596 domain-containing protein [Xylella taiwanensis]|uniref:DUF596 domain-containing protein n=1 Tax=Xylella taiwanensis TaxID=1444770 RepID=Z9JGU0_9GAMM|nr:DUF596 domain-containing protein [Xylella taiwanensis]AXI83686.1 hypothetical protein AB672_06945 [Xylella taiwanensis]EWS77006.1 hypothetical protein AF72_13095 [Xylella taiwanensis]MCD8456775.1 DUF596 domain-containing protein [Xylella taiwanensis]MCD8459185.1 DUF596 domain-containing protein [Xylella taiwanensis]MCD8461923.1 DUF596 domain-containing protein [Xylella taiwanensis]
MLNQEQIDFIYEDAGHPLSFLWFNIGEVHGISPAQVDKDSFGERKNDFLFLLRKLLDDGDLILAKKDEFVRGTKEELVDLFRKAFPASDEEVDLGGGGLWFFTDECPGEAVWILKGENGKFYFEWT